MDGDGELDVPMEEIAKVLQSPSDGERRKRRIEIRRTNTHVEDNDIEFGSDDEHGNRRVKKKKIVLRSDDGNVHKLADNEDIWKPWTK